MVLWYAIPIKNCRYEINKQGQVRNAIGKILKPNLANEYYNYRLQVNGKQKTFGVHRLLALTFIDGYALDLQVNHKNGNKLDNRLENLEWVTAKQNIQHAHKTGLVNKKLLKLSSNEIFEIYYLIDNAIFTYIELGLIYFVNRNTIYNMNVRRRGG